MKFWTKFALTIGFVFLLHGVMILAWFYLGFFWMLPAGVAVMPLFFKLREA